MRRIVLFLACVTGMVMAICGVASAATCTINGGARLTNSPIVTVNYTPNASTTEFRISNDLSFADSCTSDWQPVTPSQSTTWDLSYGSMVASGTWHTVYVEFSHRPDHLLGETRSASILLDTVAPRVFAYPATVKRGRVCDLEIWAIDVTSKCKVTLWITDKSGATRRRFVDRFRTWGIGSRYWEYRCKLPRGTYRVNVSAVDLAGNVRRYGRSATLRVK